MKFIAQGLTVNPHVWLLSGDMVKAIESSGIGLNSLENLPEHQDKIAESDIIAIAVINYAMGLKLGSPNPMIFNESSYRGVEGEVLHAKVKKAIEATPKLSLLQAFNIPSQFYVKKTLTGFIVCQSEVKPRGADWVDTEEPYFTNALLKAIYDIVGFYQVHFKDALSPLAGQFSLANVLRVLA